MGKIRNILLALSLCLLPWLQSCQDDESWQPAYITNLCEITTDTQGQATHIRLDNNKIYPVSWPKPFAKGDTIYRCAAIYTLEEGILSLHSCQQIFTITPTKEAPDPFYADPCKIESIWLAGGYLNIRLLLQGKDTPHYIDIIESGIHTNPDGSQRLTLQLYHDQNHDTPAFTITEYISCSLNQYKDLLRPGRDTIEFVAPERTYKLTP